MTSQSSLPSGTSSALDPRGYEKPAGTSDTVAPATQPANGKGKGKEVVAEPIGAVVLHLHADGSVSREAAPAKDGKEKAKAKPTDSDKEKDTAEEEDAMDVDPPQSLAVASANYFGAFSEELARRRGSTKAPTGKDEPIVPKPAIMLPAQLRGLEAWASTRYPDFLKTDREKRFPLSVVFSGDNGEEMYRQKDAPSFPLEPKTKSTGRGKSADASLPRNAVITIRDAEFEEVFSMGSLAKYDDTTAKPTDYDARDLKFEILPYTQRPIFRITMVLRSPGEEPHTVTWTCHGHSLYSDEEASIIGIAMGHGADPGVKMRLPENTSVQSLAEAENLWVAHFELNAANGEPATSKNARPTWRGITPAYLDRLVQALTLEIPLPPMQKLIAHLANATKLSVYHYMPSESQLSKFHAYVRTVAFATATLGTNWHYSLAMPDTSTTDSRYPFSEVPCPRWWVTKWQVDWKGDEPQDATADEWLHFRAVDFMEFCDPETYGFELRCAIAREAEANEKRLRRLANLDEKAVKGTFYADKSGENYLIKVQISCAHHEDKSAQPEIGRQCEIRITHHGSTIKMIGTVVDDVMGTGAPITLSARLAKPLTDPLGSDIEHNLRLEWPEDNTASNRALNAVSIMEKGQGRRDGPHFPELCLGRPRPDDLVPDWLHNFIQDEPLARFTAEIERHNLNERQLKVAMDCVGPTTTGVQLLWGPPGTGKTLCLVIIIRAFLAAGIKVMVCASTNTAVNRAMQVFKSLGPVPGVEDYQWARFTGGLSRTSIKSASGAHGTASTEAPTPKPLAAHLGSWAEAVDEDDEKERLAATFQRVALDAEKNSKQPHAEDGFAFKKLALIKQTAAQTVAEDQSTSDKEYHEGAVDYLRYFDLLNSPDLSKKKRGPVTKAFRALDEWFSAKYLSETMMCIFVTNNSSCHELIIDYYRAEALFQDEAGQSSPSDSITPAAALMEVLKFWFMAGDPQQLQPTVISSAANEGSLYLSTAIFSRMIEATKSAREFGIDDARTIPFVKLNVQYRMHPNISAWVRDAVYEGDLIDDASVTGETELDKRVAEVLQSLCGPFWNGHHRFAIDAKDGTSEPYQNSTSLHNELEATIVAELVTTLIQSKALTHEEILIVCPYNGQARCITGMLYGQSGCPTAPLVEISSTDNVQGGEGKFVIVSMTSNVQGNAQAKLQFATKAQRLNVAATRAQRFLCFVGNFQAWSVVARDTQNKANSYVWSKPGERFKSLIDDLVAKHDVISWNDMQAIKNKATPSVSSFEAGLKALPAAPAKSKKKPENKNPDNSWKRYEENKGDYPPLELPLRGATAEAGPAPKKPKTAALAKGLSAAEKEASKQSRAAKSGEAKWTKTAKWLDDHPEEAAKWLADHPGQALPTLK